MSRSDVIVKKRISNEIQDELVKNIIKDFRNLNTNISESVYNNINNITQKSAKDRNKKTIIKKYSILKWGDYESKF